MFGRVGAKDRDGGRDGEFEYILVADSNEKGFTLDRNTGDLKVTQELDRENSQVITLKAMVKNPGPVRGRQS